jgi:hypothetical protein
VKVSIVTTALHDATADALKAIDARDIEGRYPEDVNGLKRY